jgi:hypothetical protein
VATPRAAKRKPTFTRRRRAPIRIVWRRRPISLVRGGGGGSGGATEVPVAAGSVEVRSWPNLPPATQSASEGQERPNSALVRPGISRSLSQ